MESRGFLEEECCLCMWDMARVVLIWPEAWNVLGGILIAGKAVVAIVAIRRFQDLRM